MTVVLAVTCVKRNLKSFTIFDLYGNRSLAAVCIAVFIGCAPAIIPFAVKTDTERNFIIIGEITYKVPEFSLIDTVAVLVIKLEIFIILCEFGDILNSKTDTSWSDREIFLDWSECSVRFSCHCRYSTRRCYHKSCKKDTECASEFTFTHTFFIAFH